MDVSRRRRPQLSHTPNPSPRRIAGGGLRELARFAPFVTIADSRPSPPVKQSARDPRAPRHARRGLTDMARQTLTGTYSAGYILQPRFNALLIAKSAMV